VYVRDLAPDFDGSGEPRADIVSLREDDTSFGQAGNPAISADGGIVAFSSSDPLTDPSGECCGYYARQVFARTRFPAPQVAPLSLVFPPQQLGTTGPAQSITITNAGPGPVRVATAVAGGFVVTEGCLATLHRAESCVLLVAPHPLVAGDGAGLLTITLSAQDWVGDEVLVELVGVGVPPQFALAPSSISFGEQGLGIPTKPQVVRARNVSDQPIDLEASVVSVTEPVTDVATRKPPEPTVPPDFEVASAGGGRAACVAVAPGASCRLLVTFRPEGLGDREADLVVTVGSGDVPLLQLVHLSGSTAEPEIELSPTVAREGRVVFVAGSNVLPGEPLELGWSGGPVVLPSVVPDSTGSFAAPVVVLPGRSGTHILTLTMPDVGSIDSPDVVVVPGSLQPPDFVSRN
jgi:hypothetical protein